MATFFTRLLAVIDQAVGIIRDRSWSRSWVRPDDFGDVQRSRIDLTNLVAANSQKIWFLPDFRVGDQLLRRTKPAAILARINEDEDHVTQVIRIVLQRRYVVLI